MQGLDCWCKDKAIRAMQVQLNPKVHEAQGVDENCMYLASRQCLHTRQSKYNKVTMVTIGDNDGENYLKQLDNWGS